MRIFWGLLIPMHKDIEALCVYLTVHIYKYIHNLSNLFIYLNTGYYGLSLEYLYAWVRSVSHSFETDSPVHLPFSGPLLLCNTLSLPLLEATP